MLLPALVIWKQCYLIAYLIFIFLWAWCGHILSGILFSWNFSFGLGWTQGWICGCSFTWNRLYSFGVCFIEGLDQMISHHVKWMILAKHLKMEFLIMNSRKGLAGRRNLDWKTTWNWRFFLASSLADELADEFPESSSEFETSSILATPASPKLDFVTFSSSSSFADLLIISNCGWNIGFTNWTDFGKNWSVEGWDGCHAGRDIWLTGTSWLTDVSKILQFNISQNFSFSYRGPIQAMFWCVWDVLFQWASFHFHPKPNVRTYLTKKTIIWFQKWKKKLYLQHFDKFISEPTCSTLWKSKLFTCSSCTIFWNISFTSCFKSERSLTNRKSTNFDSLLWSVWRVITPSFFTIWCITFRKFTLWLFFWKRWWAIICHRMLISQLQQAILNHTPSKQWLTFSWATCWAAKCCCAACLMKSGIWNGSAGCGCACSLCACWANQGSPLPLNPAVLPSQPGTPAAPNALFGVPDANADCWPACKRLWCRLYTVWYDGSWIPDT